MEDSLSMVLVIRMMYKIEKFYSMHVFIQLCQRSKIMDLFACSLVHVDIMILGSQTNCVHMGTCY